MELLCEYVGDRNELKRNNSFFDTKPTANDLFPSGNGAGFGLGNLKAGSISNLPTVAQPRPEVTAAKKRKKKSESDVEIVDPEYKAEKKAKELTTLDRYEEPLALHRSIVAQTDVVAESLFREIQKLSAQGDGKFSSSKTRNMDLAAFSEAFAKLLNNKSHSADKISDIIKSSMDYDYKRQKDAGDKENDDIKQMMALYKAAAETPITDLPNLYNGFVEGSAPITFNPQGLPMQSQQQMADVGYQNYKANMTPEQRYMSTESNPNIRQVVIEEAKTGNAYFAYYDMSTQQYVDGYQTRNNIYLSDPETTFDRVNNKVHLNLFNESYDLIIIP